MCAKVIQLYRTLNDTNKTRESNRELTLDTEGIIGDKFYGKDIQRAILITTTLSYKMAEENSIELPAGSLGENILIDISPYHLVAGDRLSIGTAVLEITQNCTLCKGLSTIDSKLPKLLKNDRGIFAKLIGESSEIAIGDGVKFLNN